MTVDDIVALRALWRESQRPHAYTAMTQVQSAALAAMPTLLAIAEAAIKLRRGSVIDEDENTAALDALLFGSPSSQVRR